MSTESFLSFSIFLLVLLYFQWKPCIAIETQQFATKNEFYEYAKLHNLKENEPLYRVWLTDAYNKNGARCLDGSRAAFYFRPGYGSSINKFQIFLEGGGWCAGVDQQVSGLATCYQRAINDFSSKAWLPYMTIGEYMSDDPNENPLSYNWNVVYLKYCDGASFSGNNETTITYNNLTLYYRGWRILNGALKLLRNEYGFTEDITDLLLSGCSAGGLAAYIHAQYIYDEWVNHNNTRFMVLADSGFFLEYEGPNKFITGMQWIYYNMNVTISMNKKCVANYSKDNNEWKCMFAQNVSPNILLPLPGLFALQSQYDASQIKFELDTNASNTEAINQYGINLADALINNLITLPNGYRASFFDSCYWHCFTSWADNNIKIQNTSARDAAYQWYYNYGNMSIPNFWFGNKSYPCDTCGCPSSLLLC